ncbi:MAG: hypothetical protein ABR586_00640 [Thermoplasmatota archaeon]
MKTLTLTLLLGLVALALPATAQEPPAALCPVSLADSDGDGLPEPTSACSTPPCGCNCPVVGGGAHLQAAGQDLFVVAATSGCQSAYIVHADPNSPDPSGPVDVDPIVILYLP